MGERVLSLMEGLLLKRRFCSNLKKEMSSINFAALVEIKNVRRFSSCEFAFILDEMKNMVEIYPN